MRTVFCASALSLALSATGCAASFPAPTQRLADAEAAARSAREIGAESNPTARLGLELATEQIVAAKRLVAAGENERADHVLMRARADAELALTLAREQTAGLDLQKAAAQSSSTFKSNQTGGAP